MAVEATMRGLRGHPTRGLPARSPQAFLAEENPFAQTVVMEAGMNPVFDRAVAMEHVSDDVALLRSIVEMFVKQGPEQLAAIVAAVRAGNAAGLEFSAHTLQGSAAILGLGRIRAMALGLEELGEGGSVAGAEARLVELAGAMEEGLLALRRELEAMP